MSAEYLAPRTTWDAGQVLSVCEQCMGCDADTAMIIRQASRQACGDERRQSLQSNIEVCCAGATAIDRTLRGVLQICGAMCRP